MTQKTNEEPKGKGLKNIAGAGGGGERERETHCARLTYKKPLDQEQATAYTTHWSKKVPAPLIRCLPKSL